jgi:putative CocE/NonD family hydrolase
MRHWILALVFTPALYPAAPAEKFDKQSAMIRMRDGVRLNTEIYTPKQSAAALPFLILRTPYGIRHDSQGYPRALATALTELADDGYIFVFQDIRGKFGSEGEFVMIRPPRAAKGPRDVDEGTDTWDTIEWLLANVKGHNGRAGMTGVSYGGWLTIMAAIEPHPALKAISPQASPDDMWTGDDFHHNGAFRLSYGFEYVASLEGSRDNKPFVFDKYDTYEWYLRLGPLANATRDIFHGRYPTWTDFAEHPNFDDFWKRRKVSPYLRSVTVPTLNVAGWWDQEDFYGPLEIYQALEKHDARGINFLVVGPWNHGGWMNSDGAKLGPIEFGSPTGEYFRRQVLAPWFAFWLKDRGELDLPEALTFRAGANSWQRHDRWPPRGSQPKRLYLRENGVLSFDPPRTPGFDAYLSDPDKPVPYRVRPILPTYGAGSTWSIWLTDDQRHAHLRPDVASWETPALAEDVTVAGQITARLFASTTESDADWVVKLIDVYPEDAPSDMGGYQFLVANDVLRGRFRKSFEKPEPMRPNQAEAINVDLHTHDYTFRKGHKIMVQVQSSWFPLIDRNPQKFVPNIFLARREDFRAATHRIYRSPKAASHIELPVAVR